MQQISGERLQDLWSSGLLCISVGGIKEVKDEHSQLVAQYLVIKRAGIEPNFHTFTQMFQIFSCNVLLYISV